MNPDTIFIVGFILGALFMYGMFLLVTWLRMGDL